MPAFAIQEIAELAHQLTISPARLRLSQIGGIEKLLGIVKLDGSYPYDLVCYHITGYHPRARAPKATLPGRKLVNDLVLMAEHISRKANIPIAQLDGSIFSQEELAEELSVSTKTIRRWRARGLMSLRVVHEDGVSRQVFLANTVQRFRQQNEGLVRRGAAFKQLSEAERDGIVKRARELLSVRRRKLHDVAREVAAATGRAVETVRYTLRRYDQARPDKALFANGGMPRVSEQHLAVWRCHRAGETPKRIAAACNCDVECVEQILREMEVRQLKEQPRPHVYSDEFAAPNADSIILGPEPKTPPREGKPVRVPKDLPPYLRSLYDIPLLTPEQELDLFRRYNYLKYRASVLLAEIDEVEVTAEELAALRRLFAAADEIKARIIQANLRLVVSIAKKHVSARSDNFFEVVSDGNMSLMRAVENFDYARGNKFSTYASWAIMKNYARTIPENHYRFARYVTGQDELLEAEADHRAAPESAERTEGLREMLTAGLAALTERERAVVTDHFGLFGAGASQTLEQIGQRFGVTKERVRQIEKRALDKLQQSLSPAVVDLLVE